ncbi:ABC transporter ATP-binding protein [Kineosporia babensis]|uniref:ABC-type quaternary amine transporter n=1 Tax=Kineosporia babensis TaxID=499548 RepID=A0A9X1NJY9_9ACTN|nr:ABC transporter ATP-binding protein [Kineosporia babensis]MCD5314959.1 ABC transporter ATP-binding protein [Kineosporia babensis]
MTSTPVQLQEVVKQFSGRTVLESIDLNVHGGELLALLGPSGCGKTTALRIIAGFERADAGRVLIGGRDVSRVPASRRGVGIVFQAYSLFPHLSAEQNVAYGLAVRGLPRRERRKRAGELLELVGLAEHGAKFPHQLSGGQQQRVALARAFAVEPSVLLLDEPLSALDAFVRQQLREEIRRVQREVGTTTVLVTHDQEEALSMADRVAVMHQGRFAQIGTPSEIYRTPASSFVASFVGVVNRVPATINSNGRVGVLGAELTTSSAHRGEATALLRPEDLQIQPDPEGRALVTGTTLRGAITSIEVTWQDTPVRVDVPTGTATRFSAGDRVRITPAVDNVLVEKEAAA